MWPLEKFLCSNGNDTNLKINIAHAFDWPVLLFRFQGIYQSSTIVKEIETLQAKLLKCISGLKRQCIDKTLLNALTVVNVIENTEMHTLELLGMIILSDSRSTCSTSLLGRDQIVSNGYIISMVNLSYYKNHIRDEVVFSQHEGQEE